MVADRIEREIVISASVQRVWAALVDPAFWVAEGETAQAEVAEGKTVVSEHSEYGRFPQRIEKIEPHRFLSYRWASTFPGEDPGEGNSTLVEFTVTEEDGKTRLRVVESGFAALAAAEEQRRGSWESNTEGWVQVLDELRQKLEKSTT